MLLPCFKTLRWLPTALRIKSAFLAWPRKPRRLLLLCHSHLCSGLPAQPLQSPLRRAPRLCLHLLLPRLAWANTLFPQTDLPWPNYLQISPIFLYRCLLFISFIVLSQFAVTFLSVYCLFPMNMTNDHHGHHLLDVQLQEGRRSQLDTHSVSPTSLLMSEWVPHFSPRSTGARRVSHFWN